MDKLKPSQMAQKVEFIEFYDDFLEFSDYCSFLCDAVSCLFADAVEGEPDAHTVLGLKRQCGDLKERAEKLESVLNNLYQQPYTDGQITTLKPRT